MSKHREYPTVVIGSGQQFELGEDVGDMGLDGLRREEQSVADGLVRATIGHQGEHLALALGQVVERAERAAERIRQAIEDLRLHYPTPSGPQILTISAGIALLGRGAAHDENEVLRAADAALYRVEAGESGRATPPRQALAAS